MTHLFLPHLSFPPPQTDHPDYGSVKGALEAMRDVALLVNERKRRMECLEKIASWQMTVEGWEVSVAAGDWLRVLVS